MGRWTSNFSTKIAYMLENRRGRRCGVLMGGSRLEERKRKRKRKKERKRKREREDEKKREFNESFQRPSLIKASHSFLLSYKISHNTINL